GIGGVILTNADSGWRVATAVMRRTLEVVYDGKPEAEENLLSGVRETRAFLTGEQRDWRVPPEPSEVKRLAGSYRNAALGEIVVREGKDEVVFQFGGWKSRMASRVNPDGTTSFLSIEPGVRGFEFKAHAARSMDWIARLASETANRVLSVATTIASGACATYDPLDAKAPSRRSVAPSRITMKCHGCPFIPLPVRCPASTIRRTTASGTGLSW